MDARGQAAFARALLDPDLPPPAGLVGANGGDLTRRFAIYRNNVVVSLVDGLAARFPVTQQLVGETFFGAAAALYFRAEPPRSRLLHELGETWPDFLERFEPAAGLPWLADLARLEAARTRAFHAADAEPFGAAELAALAPTELARLRLRLHPSVQLVPSRWPIVSLWAAHLEAEPAALEAALAQVDLTRGEDALAWRPGLEVFVRVLPAGGLAFLAALGRGRPLAEATAQAGPATDPAELLALLAGDGVALRHIPEEESAHDP